MPPALTGPGPDGAPDRDPVGAPDRDNDVALSHTAAIAPAATPAESRTCRSAWRLQCWRGVLRLAPAIACAAAAGCIYTGPINERPRAEIEKLTAGPYHYPGERVELVARKSLDAEDGPRLRCTWSAYSCATEDGVESCEPLGPSLELAPDEVFTVDIPPRDHRVIAVELIARDRSGALSRDVIRLEVGNRAPLIDLSVTHGGQAPATTASFVVTVPIEIAVREATDPDGDPVELSWSLVDRPAGSDPNAVSWRPLASGDAYELVPDVPGLWRVDVTASDGVDERGISTRSEQILVDEDQPPCVALTSPAAPAGGRFVLRRDDEPRTFAVLSATDDLDPHPRPVSDSPYLGAAGFRWFRRGPQTAGDLVPVSGAGPQLTVDPADHAPGDLLELRVEVTDRVPRTMPCAADAPSCGAAGDFCLQRVSWEVEIR